MTGFTRGWSRLAQIFLEFFGSLILPVMQVIGLVPWWQGSTLDVVHTRCCVPFQTPVPTVQNLLQLLQKKGTQTGKTRLTVWGTRVYLQHKERYT